MLARGGKLAQTSPHPKQPDVSSRRSNRAGRVGIFPNAMLGEIPP